MKTKLLLTGIILLLLLSCGKNEKTSILIKTKGTTNLTITNNTFKNTPIKVVAMLWIEKNCYHINNVLLNSGNITIKEQQKLGVLYQPIGSKV